MNSIGDPISLQTETAHVWCVSAQVSAEQCAILRTVLSAAERQALDRIVPPGERERRLVAWARMRQVLSQYLGCGPEEIALVRERNRRPRMADPEGIALELSLSHAGDHALVGVSRHPIGVDIETIDRALPTERLARRFFAPEELAWLERLPDAERGEGVLRLWVLKEAVFKAIGGGVPAGLSRCAIRMNIEPPTVADRTASGRTLPVHLSEISSPPGTRAAVAVACPNASVVLFDGSVLGPIRSPNATPASERVERFRSTPRDVQ
jgi:4'-phosphopantetheinyl transferase